MIQYILEDIKNGFLQTDFSRLGFDLYSITLFAFFCILITISVIDWKTMEIPPTLNLAIFLLGIVSIFTMGEVGIFNRILGFFAVSLPLYLIVLVIPEGFGGGDIKLMAAAGFFMGWKTTLLSFMIALLLGGLYGAVLLILRKKGRKDHFAFGPFLCFGMICAIFFGKALVDWYLGLAYVMAYGTGV